MDVPFMYAVRFFSPFYNAFVTRWFSDVKDAVDFNEAVGGIVKRLNPDTQEVEDIP